jgi:hypothetical protein
VRSESEEAIQLFSATNGRYLSHREHRWLWVPAFAGTTRGALAMTSA